MNKQSQGTTSGASKTIKSTVTLPNRKVDGFCSMSKSAAKPVDTVGGR